MTTRPEQPTPPSSTPGMGSRLQACANPLCLCETVEFTCSLRCGPLDVRQSARCQCRHDACTRPVARAAPPLPDTDLYPPVLDRFRLDRRVASRGRG